jgi:hypothetical protein
MMAAHYGVGVLPARPRKPRDKAKVEAAVRFARSYILGRLRHQTSSRVPNATWRSRAAWSASMPTYAASRSSRRDLFERIERPALGALGISEIVGRDRFAFWRPRSQSSCKAHASVLAACTRKVSGPQMFRNQGEFVRHFKRQFSNRHL